jgi:hypothetical protein
MSPKARRLKGKIPGRRRLAAKVGKWAGSLWRDIRKKPAAVKAGKNDPWPTCPLCDKQKPPWIFGQCEEHPESCGCCLYNLHKSPPQRGGRKRKKARPSQFKKGDPASAESQHARQQAEYQAEIEEQGRQEAEARQQEQGSESAGQDSQGADTSSEGGGEE